MADPLLPIQRSDAEPADTAGAEPGPFPSDADTEPDVLPGSAAGDPAQQDVDADDPAVSDATPFRTPTGDRVDPADD